VKKSPKQPRKLSANQIALLAAALTPPVEKFDATKLEHVYSFDEEFPQEPNTLWADKDNRLYFTEGNDNHIDRGGESIPLKDALQGEFRETSLRDALSWYARCQHFSGSGVGTAELLCQLAAEALSKEVA
jgi:hypothetical protein